MNFVFDASVVLYLPLHELDGSSFMSGDAYGHLCTANGAVWRPDGYYFDGVSDYIDCGNQPSIRANIVNGTVECWARTPASAVWMGLIGTARSDGTHGYRMGISNGGYLSGLIGDNTSYNNLVSTNTVLDDDAWRHLAFTFDANYLKLFVDGNEDCAAIARTKTITCDKNFRIGAWADLVSYYTGTIGEVRVYNRALTPQEIQHNYQATKWRYQ